LNSKSRLKSTKDTEKEAWEILLVLYAVWGSVFLANRFALESFPPFLLNAVRFLGGGGILYVILRLKGTKEAVWPRLKASAPRWPWVRQARSFDGSGPSRAPSLRNLQGSRSLPGGSR